VQLLRAGLPLLVFPEGYPNVDPSYTPKTDDDEFLPFRPGFIRFVALAERDGLTRVPIVPVGLEYRRGDRWRLTIRFGPPITFAPGVDKDERVLAIEEQVRRLSSSPDGTALVIDGGYPGSRPARARGISSFRHAHVGNEEIPSLALVMTRFSRSERPQRKQAIVGSVPCVRLLRFENGEWE
jgi:hypothetical protein